MNIPFVNIAFLAEDIKLVKDKAAPKPLFKLMLLQNEGWLTLHSMDDPAQAANLLIRCGYESEHLSAVKLLDIL